ncbi:hypothetical protein EZV62_008105 [Acer yangbiense]|uniref:P-type ATPase A domain-containing protein n=1 Tax=Acer yangbiense TaxID=1000413 RepID=A0A5C7IBT4_9ROSI|nr:hypothetical protein EZV62_008105 [Acer yangbiense]
MMFEDDGFDLGLGDSVGGDGAGFDSDRGWCRRWGWWQCWVLHEDPRDGSGKKLRSLHLLASSLHAVVMASRRSTSRRTGLKTKILVWIDVDRWCILDSDKEGGTGPVLWIANVTYNSIGGMSSCPGSVDLECQSQKAVLMEQEPTEIVQVLPTSTDHSQASTDISFDASNDDVNENLKLQHERVAKIVKSRDLNSLQRFGGVNGIAQALGTDLHKGIPGDENDLCSRRHIDNNHAPAAQCILKVLLRCCNSSVIFFLSVSAVLSIGFGIDEKGLRTGWYEGCIITLGIIVLVVLSSIREFLNEKQNKKQKRSYSQVGIDVLRGGGNWQKISISDVLLGDIVGLRRGYEVPGDGLFISGGNLKLDDGSTTTTIDECSPFIYYGSKVINGDGCMLVTSVGMNTALGEMTSQVTNEPAGKITFLPAKIDKLSITTQIIGLSISILIPVVLFLRFKFGNEHDHHDSEAPEIKGKSISIQVFGHFISLKQSGSVNVFTTSLTLLVVGFVEGVPFIVTLAIIYWNKKALCDKGYVKESLACVGMGSVTTICTGKIGGLTLSSEAVEVLWIDEQVISEETVIDTSVVEALCNGISALGTVKILDENKRSAFHQNIQHMRSKDLKTVAFAYKMWGICVLIGMLSFLFDFAAKSISTLFKY